MACSLYSWNFVSLSSVKRIQMTLFAWKLAYKWCCPCHKVALQWREWWLCHMYVTFFVSLNLKSMLAVINHSRLKQIHHFWSEMNILKRQLQLHQTPITCNVILKKKKGKDSKQRWTYGSVWYTVKQNILISCNNPQTNRIHSLMVGSWRHFLKTI